ncbi:MAG: matrixin family metalloprotease [Nitrospinae bacterium]|nr:matrixin family metalloprotease [Nitrospinota bacterium]
MRNKNRFAQKAFSVLLSLALLLPGCGGGGGGGGGSSFPRQPALMPAQALNAPVIARSDGVQIGGDVRPSLSNLSPAGTHGGAAISSGRVRDGESSARVLDVIEKHAVVRRSDDPGNKYLRLFEGTPVVRIRETTPDRYIDEVIRVVQLMNTALPYDKRIIVSPERAPRPGFEESWPNYIPERHIFVGIEPQDSWPPDEKSPVRVAGTQFGSSSSGIYIWVNTSALTNTNHMRKVLAHELGHALGLREHIEPGDYNSIMNTGYRNISIPAHLLHQIDTDALHALYTRFLEQYGTSLYDPNKLGSWTDVSFHLRGDVDDVSFGASSRNGLIQPWAHGPGPSTNLSGMGSASWSGRLLGFTSRSQSLAGAVDLTINLEALSGRIDFTGLEHWGVNATPGPVGSGRTWNDGDLSYSVTVRGNTFTQTGGDAGEVTGAFFGPNHEGMGGVVERSDMSAGFGGTR